MSLLIRLITPLLLYIVAVNSRRADIVDYCSQHPRNTPCVHDCMRSSQCGHTNTSYETFSDEMREAIVQKHNEYRSRIASGASLVILPPQLSAFNPLSYDKECEFIAGCYIKQCRNHPDKLRIALDGTHLGQNRFVMSVIRGHYTLHSRVEMRGEIIAAALRAWFSPATLFTEEYIRELHDAYYPIIYPQRAATFTQMVWEDTRYVGCAFMHSVRDSKWDMYEFICNYRPKGNVLGKKVYRLHNNSTTCQREFKDGMHAAMCVNFLRDPRDDKYRPPFKLDAAIGVHTLSIRCHFLFLCVLLFLILQF